MSHTIQIKVGPSCMRFWRMSTNTKSIAAVVLLLIGGAAAYRMVRVAPAPAAWAPPAPAAQPVPAAAPVPDLPGEAWRPSSTTATAITGGVSFVPSMTKAQQIVFEAGALPVDSVSAQEKSMILTIPDGRFLPELPLQPLPHTRSVRWIVATWTATTLTLATFEAGSAPTIRDADEACSVSTNCSGTYSYVR